MPGISCFMIVRNCIKQGYPFAEVMANAMPLCEEFLVSDGYSTDGTFEALERMAASNRKIRVYRYEWPIGKVEGGRIFADATNALRAKCKSDYIFSLQANEVIHEDSLEFIRQMPEVFRGVDAFSLPYLSLLCEIKFLENFRVRLCRNVPYIQAVEDAWTLGLSRQFMARELLGSLVRPKRLLLYFAKGMERTYADPGYARRTTAVYLPKPIFRYYSMTPKNLLDKVRGHAELYGGETREFERILSALEDSKRRDFWLAAYDILKDSYRRDGVERDYPQGTNIVPKPEHPKVMQGIMDSASYGIREEVFESIRQSA